MKIVLEGEVTDLGNIDISKIEEIMIYVHWFPDLSTEN